MATAATSSACIVKRYCSSCPKPGSLRSYVAVTVAVELYMEAVIATVGYLCTLSKNKKQAIVWHAQFLECWD